jgi:drug/metabolite transporter (DMT)-like permease
MDLKKLSGSVVLCSFFVLLAACCYGILSTIVKIAVGNGVDISVILVGKFFYGLVILSVLVILVHFLFPRNNKLEKSTILTWKRGMILFFTGIVMCLVTVCYFYSVSYLPISVAVILLFQFSWMGVVIEVVANRRMSSRNQLIAVVIIFVGTILAGGTIGFGLEINPFCVILGLFAAFFYAMFVFLSGRVEPAMTSINRSFLIAFAGFVFVCVFIAYIDSPMTILSGIFASGSLIYGVALGLFGVTLPILFLAIGSPRISTGMATILNAAELPIEVLAATVFLAETMSDIQWVGVLVILAGIAFPHLMEKKISSGLSEDLA